MENYKSRNFGKVASKIKNIIKDNYNSELKYPIIKEIDRIIYDRYMCWNNLADVLNAFFNPDNSEWEKEIRDIFNGKIKE